MIDFFRWTLAIEIIGLAFLPLTVWFFRALPDRGYIFAKVLGLLLLTYGTWLVGNLIPVGGNLFFPLLLLLVAGGAGWWFWRKQAVETVRGARRLILAEECLFLAALVLWSLLRAYVIHPDIHHTEQFMDMALLNASYKSASYPPFDPWMSGHGINYYYFGYLMFGTLARLSGVVPTVAYNLSLSFLAASTIAGAFSLGYALCRRFFWAAIAPLFVAVIGNWHAILIQIPANHLPSNTFFWFWDSSRVVGGVRADYTINEFPFFSFLLGDLHPHVMSLPVSLLAVAVACTIAFSETPFTIERSPVSAGRLALAGVCIGALFTINSWDFPTYLLVVGASIAANAYVRIPTTTWWRPALIAVVSLALASVVLFLPFYAHFKSLAHGIGLVTTRADVWEFFQIYGLFLVACLFLIASLSMLLQPAEEEDFHETEEPRPTPAARSQVGAVSLDAAAVLFLLALLGVAILGVSLQVWVLVVVLALGCAAAIILNRVVNTEEPDMRDAVALILVAAGCLVLALTEVIYLRDSFDGSSMYRMNTVFKFYYQAWVLLGLAGAYGVYRGWGIVRQYFGSAPAWLAVTVLALGAAAGGVYTVLAPQSSIGNSNTVGLDGAAWMRSQMPGDYSAIRWLDVHTHGNPVELEATGGEYTEFARISTFAGLPTVMGWAGHEGQWRGADPAIQQRVDAVKTIYTTTSVSTATALLRRYHVQYVIVGDKEREAYPAGTGLAKFGRFMRPVFRKQGTTIYTW